MQFNGAALHAKVAVLLGDAARHTRSDRAVFVRDRKLRRDVLLASDVRFENLQQFVVERHVMAAIVALLLPHSGKLGIGLNRREQLRQVDQVGAVARARRHLLKQVGPPDDLVQ